MNSERRKVGGYIWAEKADTIIHASETLTKGLTELSDHATTVQVSRLITRLIATNALIAVAAMELKGYKP